REDHAAVSSERFRDVHCAIGAILQVGQTGTVLRIITNPNARTQKEKMPLHLKRHGEGGQHPRTEFSRVVRSSEFADQSDEFVAANTSQYLIFRKSGRETIRKKLKQPVPDAVTKGVICLLEAIQVDEKDGLALRRMFLNGGLEAL